jgi:3-dehydroshikimate dehydratase
MIHPGLVSVTFRQLSPRQIVDLVVQAGLESIEWGGDLHVPHGDFTQAEEVRRMTENAGLQVAAYGSYYRVWPREPLPFSEIIKTGQALGAPVIRVWAGKTGSQETHEDSWEKTVEEARRIAEQAAQAGIAIAFEYHRNTLTDTAASALRLLREIDHPNVHSYWQPPVDLPVEENVQGLRKILPWLWNIHVFAWRPAAGPGDLPTRLALSESRQAWRQYIDVVATTQKDHHALIEFVRDDSSAHFLEDAGELLKLLHGEG